jgi:phosphomevalonate kinase
MEYPWNNEIIIQAAESDPETGTNEPVGSPKGESTTDSPEDQPDPSLAEQIVSGDTGIDTQAQIDELKKQLEDMLKKFDLENEVQDLKKRLENIHVPDDTNMNDSLNQSASTQIKFVKRAIRRIMSKNVVAGLTGKQQQLITTELDQHPQLSCQQISAELSEKIGASEQDIFDFIRNSDYRFRHRHWREL